MRYVIIHWLHPTTYQPSRALIGYYTALNVSQPAAAHVANFFCCCWRGNELKARCNCKQPSLQTRHDRIPESGSANEVEVTWTEKKSLKKTNKRNIK